MTFPIPLILNISEDIILMLITVLGHEAGHYLAAQHFGWNPRFGFDRGSLKPFKQPAFAVYAQTAIQIDSVKDFFKAYYQLTFFGSAGILGALLPIILFNLLGVIELQVAFLLTLTFVLYGIIEVSNPNVQATEEAKQ